RQRPAAHDGPRDPPGVRLLAVLEDDARKLRLGKPVQERGGGFADRGIQSHVERLVTLEREAALRLLELPRGHAEIQQNRARVLDAARGGGVRETAEARVRQAHPVAEPGQTLARLGQRRGVRVQTEKTHRARAGVQDRLGVTAHADRRIDHPSLAARSQEKHDLVGEHRNVNRYTPRPESLSNSVGSRSARVRSYSSNRPRSHTSNWGSPPPTSVTSFESPACSRASGGMSTRPAASSDTSFARQMKSRLSSRPSGLKIDCSRNFVSMRCHSSSGCTSRQYSFGTIISAPSYCARGSRNFAVIL